jgi:hypothetical protein
MDYREHKENFGESASRLHLNRGIKVRKNTRFCAAFAFCVHLLPPNRLPPGIQTTNCTAQTRNASA